VSWLRDFSQRHVAPVERNIDNDAPGAMRNELVDFFFDLAERSFRGEASDRYSREQSTILPV